MKLLVPYDGSENAMRAAKYALNMAKADPKVEVTVLAVACLHEDFKFEAASIEEPSSEECKNLFAARLEEAQKIFADAGVKANAVLMQGDPADSIIYYVNKYGMDKIVMGSRGLSPFKGAVLGSVAFKVLNQVKVPVTIVK